jgi:hypothetical protein
MRQAAMASAACRSPDTPERNHQAKINKYMNQHRLLPACSGLNKEDLWPLIRW